MPTSKNVQKTLAKRKKNRYDRLRKQEARQNLPKADDANHARKGGNAGMVFEKIREILMEQLDVEESVVTMEASILEDLGADSLDIVDLVMTLEDEFDMEIPDEEIETIKTVGDIVRFIEDHN